MGYARCSTAQQELQSQLDALAEAGCDPVFSEKISTRIKVRPEFVEAMDFARTIKKAVPHQRVIPRDAPQAHMPDGGKRKGGPRGGWMGMDPGITTCRSGALAAGVLRPSGHHGGGTRQSRRDLDEFRRFGSADR
ncbi:recombinase family protein [Streptomyces sp. NPDC014733]|uniref:recombinase family protein n=1 Tax=Streptomyces sp. NPDC014733 TaxID=3364885 RepID=UPI0036F98D8F